MKKGHEDMKIKVLKTFQEKVHWLYQFVKRIHNMHNRRLRISALDSWGKKTIQMCLEASNLFLYKKKGIFQILNKTNSAGLSASCLQPSYFVSVYLSST